MYNYLLKNINNFLRFYYYDYYYKNENEFKNLKNNIFKLEYFLYLRFYLIYLFFYYFKEKNIILYSFLLNFQHTIGEICMTNYKHYNIQSNNDINFLNNVSKYLFDYLLFNQIYFNKDINYVNKIIILLNTFLFHMGIIINKLFTKRIEYIKNNKNLDENFNFLFLLPGFEDLFNTVEKTRFMNYSNFYFYLTVLFWTLY